MMRAAVTNVGEETTHVERIGDVLRDVGVAHETDIDRLVDRGHDIWWT